MLKKLIIGCLIISFPIFILMSNAFHLVKKIDGEAFQYQQLDVLGIGNSNLYSAFSPQLYYKLYRQKSYLMATANQSIDETYLYLCDFLEHTRPSVILYEVDELYSHYNPKHCMESQRPTFQQTSFSFSDVKCTKTRSSFVDEYGFHESQLLIPGLHLNYMKKTNRSLPITQPTLQYFDLIVQLSKTYQIPLILISVPSASSWTMEKHNSVSLLAQRYDLDYFDLNLLAQMNWLTDSRDGGIHLNNNGATKVTKQIGELLDSVK